MKNAGDDESLKNVSPAKEYGLELLRASACASVLASVLQLNLPSVCC